VPDAPSILVLIPDRKTQRVVQRILGATLHHVEVAEGVDQAERFLAHRTPALLIVDGALVAQGAATRLLATAVERGTVACLTLLTSPSTVELPQLLQLGAVTNLLANPMPVLAEELTATALKLLRRDLFGLEKYLAWGAQIQESHVRRASERGQLVEQLAAAVRGFGLGQRVASMAMLVTDELISNAVHNAPVDGAGLRYRRDLPRDADLALQGKEIVRLRWACDARYLAIEVLDQFGSLDRDSILAALAKAGARDGVRDDGSGAGMGLVLTYRSCDHLVFNLDPGVRTEVIALIDVRFSPSERAAAGSSYNVFVARGDAHARR
jgi:anti-sigma regulatory factor (Ser/Thr protein kinase)